MANDFLNKTGLTYFYNRIKTIFATKTELDEVSDRIDDIVSEGGEPNTIDSVSVNGTAVTPDSNKNVEIGVPTKVSDLTNDGDGTTGSRFATEAYVDSNGGKIDKINVNGVEQTISQKTVSLTVPTKVSDLTNDSQFQTAQQVSDAIDAKVASAYKYKGSVATVGDLPSSGNTAGDVYDVQATGINYAWTGTAWDALGQIVDTTALWGKTELTAITTSDIDTITA